MKRATSDIRAALTALTALAAVADQDIDTTPGQGAFIEGAIFALRWVVGDTDHASLLIPREPLV